MTYVAGAQVGNWTVLAPSKADRFGRKRVLLRCRCGTERVKVVNDLKHGRLASSCSRCTKKRGGVRKKAIGPKPAPKSKPTAQPGEKQVAESVVMLARHAMHRARDDWKGASDRELQLMAELYLQRAVTALQEGE